MSGGTPNFRGVTPKIRGGTPKIRGDTPKIRGIPLKLGVPNNDSIAWSCCRSCKLSATEQLTDFGQAKIPRL